MSALEAMSLAKPVIVTDSCGLAPAVRDGAAGIVVDSSAASLEAAMERLLLHADERRELGTNARRLVSERYTIDRVVEQLVADYSDAASGAGGS